MVSKFSASTRYQVMSRLALRARGDVAHEVFDEDRIVVGALGDGFFVGPLEQAVELARGAVFHERGSGPRSRSARWKRTAKVTMPRWLCAPCSLIALEHGQSVVTGTITVTTKSTTSSCERGGEAHGVIHQPDRAGDGRLFLEEKRELEIDVRASRSRAAASSSRRSVLDVVHVQLGAEFVQHLDEAAHVRALEMVRQIDGQRDRGDGVLHRARLVADLHRVAQAFTPTRSMGIWRSSGWVCVSVSSVSEVGISGKLRVER